MARIAFLGAGNMAAAIVDGLIAKKAARPDQLVCFSASGKTSAALAARTGIAVAHSLPELCAEADILIIAFKPQHLATADAALANLSAGKLVVSLLAGKRLATLAKHFPHARALVRAMPNTPGRIGAGITGWCADRSLSSADAAHVQTMLAALGTVAAVEETLMDTVTAIGGSGPGFVFEIAAAFIDAAVQQGMSPEMARVFVAEVFSGSGKLMQATGENPETLRRQVTSPNGTTAAGLKALEDGGLRALIAAAVAAARKRGEELSRD